MKHLINLDIILWMTFLFLMLISKTNAHCGNTCGDCGYVSCAVGGTDNSCSCPTWNSVTSTYDTCCEWHNYKSKCVDITTTCDTLSKPTEWPSKRPTSWPTPLTTQYPTSNTKSPTWHTKSPTWSTKAPTWYTKSPTWHTRSPTWHTKSPSHHPTWHTKSPTTTLPTKWPTVSPITLIDQCNINKKCSGTDDCCAGSIWERNIGVTCSNKYKLSKYWIENDLSDHGCCILAGYKCTHNIQCCKMKGLCHDGICTNKQNIPKSGWILEAVDNAILNTIKEVETDANMTELVMIILAILVLVSMFWCCVCRCRSKKRQMKRREIHAYDEGISNLPNEIESESMLNDM